MRVVGSDSNGVAFATTGEARQQDGTKKDISTITCFNCQGKGHYSSNCPKKTKDAMTHTQTGAVNNKMTGIVYIQEGITGRTDDMAEELITSFHFCNIGLLPKELSGVCQLQGEKLPSSWIILDSGSTIDVFTNPNLLRNIKTTSTTMNIRCNAGVTRTNQQGELDGYGTVWYNPQGIANILLLSSFQEKNRVSYDSEIDGKFVVHQPDGSQRVFEKSESGLYFLDTAVSISGTMMITTVEDKKSTMTNQEYASAVLARKAQNMVGRPSTRAFINIVNLNQLKNCPVSEIYIHIAKNLFGPNLGSLKGKTVRRSGVTIVRDHVNIPQSIFEKYRALTLCIDIMFVNRIALLVTIFQKLKFGTVEVIPNCKGPTIMKGIENV
jgi:Zinc knuckle